MTSSLQNNAKAVVGRFAPSPSGRMHLGNAFAALLAWLSVRSVGGRLLLRIEDLDQQRCTAEKARQLKEDLLWLGLEWDEETAPQSRRSGVYQQAMAKLEQQGLIYPCWCSRGMLQAASAPHAADGHEIYPGACRRLSPREQAIRLAERPAARRLILPDRELGFCDGVQGAYSENLARDCGDIVLQKADGGFAYQLAVVVDDGDSGVTQVVRGRDLLSSTPRQLYLQECLGYAAPQYYHVPLLLAADGHRLSKREHDLDIGQLRKRYSQRELLGWLSHWGGLQPAPAPINLQELIDRFSWDKVPGADIVIPC